MKALFAGLVSLAFACGAQAAPWHLEFRAKGEAKRSTQRAAPGICSAWVNKQNVPSIRNTLKPFQAEHFWIRGIGYHKDP